jgi:hypothetical protein
MGETKERDLDKELEEREKSIDGFFLAEYKALCKKHGRQIDKREYMVVTRDK